MQKLLRIENLNVYSSNVLFMHAAAKAYSSEKVQARAHNLKSLWNAETKADSFIQVNAGSGASKLKCKDSK